MDKSKSTLVTVTLTSKMFENVLDLQDHEVYLKQQAKAKARQAEEAFQVRAASTRPYFLHTFDWYNSVTPEFVALFFYKSRSV